jgi:hypothetical protein
MECRFCHKAFSKGEHLSVSDIGWNSSSSVANKVHRGTNEAVRQGPWPVGRGRGCFLYAG